MPDIFDEVDEELRADRAQALLKRHGGTMLAVAIAIVLAAAGYQGWRWYDQKRIGAVATDYMAAMRTEAEKGPAREAALSTFAAVADKGDAGYRTLARLQEAGLKAANGDLAGASRLWDAVAADSSADPLLRDLANLQWAIHHLDTADTGRGRRAAGTARRAEQPVAPAGRRGAGDARPAAGQARRQRATTLQELSRDAARAARRPPPRRRPARAPGPIDA